MLCIQWVLFAKQPLSPEQLYHALLSRVDPDAVSEWDPDDITREDMKRFILNSSKGLTEATVTKDSRIQFIHESVRDFLLEENGLSKIWPEFVDNFQGQSHERLKQNCYDYISLGAASSPKIPDDLLEASAQQTADLHRSATQVLPFLKYAVHNVLYHADMAGSGGISQAEFLDSFPISQWVRLDNLFEKHRVRRHTQHVSLLYLLAEFDMANLFRVLSSASQCMDVEVERYGCPLFAAAAMSSEKTLRLCMESIETQRADSRPVAVEKQQYQHTPAQRPARRDVVYSKSKSFLMNAVALGHDEVFALLTRSGRFEIDAKDSKDYTLLWLAANNGWEIVARSLLSAGSTMVNSKYGEKTPLHVAVDNGNHAVVRVLLDSGADVDARGGFYGNALQTASARGYKEIVELLLEKGADVNAQGGTYGNAVQAAFTRGHDEIVELLQKEIASQTST